MKNRRLLFPVGKLTVLSNYLEHLLAVRVEEMVLLDHLLLQMSDISALHLHMITDQLLLLFLFLKHLGYVVLLAHLRFG